MQMQHDIASIDHFALVYPRLVKTIRTLTDPRSLPDSRGCCCLTEFRGVFPRSVMSQWQKQIRKVNIELRTLTQLTQAPGGQRSVTQGAGRGLCRLSLLFCPNFPKFVRHSLTQRC